MEQKDFIVGSHGCLLIPVAHGNYVKYFVEITKVGRKYIHTGAKRYKNDNGLFIEASDEANNINKALFGRVALLYPSEVEANKYLLGGKL